MSTDMALVRLEKQCEAIYKCLYSYPCFLICFKLSLSCSYEISPLHMSILIFIQHVLLNLHLDIMKHFEIQYYPKEVFVKRK